ncbi:hypothetical protein [Actinokineospora sp. NPDC004072]
MEDPKAPEDAAPEPQAADEPPATTPPPPAEAPPPDSAAAPASRGTAVLAEAPAVEVVRSIAVDRASLRATNPVSSGHCAVVYVTKRGDYRLGVGRLTAAEIWLTPPRELHEVDVAPHPATFDIDLPSRQEAFHFTASVRVVWQVVDPVHAVRSRLSDPQHDIKAYLEKHLREITRGFDVEQNAAAERRINGDYANRSVHLSPALALRIETVVLQLDEETRAHIAARTLADREDEAAQRSKLSNAIKHELALQAAEFERERERLQQSHQMQLQQERIKFYAEALRSDTLNVLAMRLDGHGEDVNDVINLLMKQRQMEFQEASSMLERILEANLADRKDVAALMAGASKHLVDRIRGDGGTGFGALPAAGGAPAPAEVAATRPDREDDDDPNDY